jgi:hypothetical protein
VVVGGDGTMIRCVVVCSTVTVLGDVVVSVVVTAVVVVSVVVVSAARTFPAIVTASSTPAARHVPRLASCSSFLTLYDRTATSSTEASPWSAESLVLGDLQLAVRRATAARMPGKVHHMGWRAVMTAGALAALAVAGAAQAAPRTPLRVTEETLLATSSSFSGACDPAGTSTMTFSVSGTATGLFAGSFVETGTVTLAGGRATSFQTSFSIEGGGYHVVGVRTAGADDLARSIAFCGEIAWGYPNGLSIQLRADYLATIQGHGAKVSDAGSASITYGDIGAGGAAAPVGMVALEYLVVP